jgi:hypothetical protein
MLIIEIGTKHDRNKLPALENYVIKGIPQYFAVAKSCFHLSSNRSLFVITLTTHVLNQKKQPSLSKRHTNWDNFRHLINKRLTINVSLKTEEDIEAADEFFKDTMPEHTETLKANDCPILIKQR